MTAKKKKPPRAFTSAEWAAIRKNMKAKPERYGLPKRVKDSLVLGSFNIRKLGKIKTGSAHERNKATWQFLADVCKRFDLLAVQEVMSSTEGVRKLAELMGPKYRLIVSDTTGQVPGSRAGMPERSAFIYNSNIVERTELVTDVTYDRADVLDALVREFPRIKAYVDGYRRAMDAYTAAKAAPKNKTLLAAYRKAMDAYEAAKKRHAPKPSDKPRRKAPRKEKASTKLKKPKLKMPAFLSFVRTPFAVGFKVKDHEFLAVCAHLLYGDDEVDRQDEGAALVKWMMGKAREVERKRRTSLVLFGDLNLDYDNPKKDMERIARVAARYGGKPPVQASFPFLCAHPKNPPAAGGVFRTNIVLNQTFDQIGIFTTDARLKKRLATKPPAGAGQPATHANPKAWGSEPQGPDYGVFNFTELFSESIKPKVPFAQRKGAHRKGFIPRYSFRVSDHMPIWYRFPLA